MSVANEKTIKQQLSELEEIVAWFERDDVDIEEAIKKFDDGEKLAAEVAEKLKVMENKITVLKESFEAS